VRWPRTRKSNRDTVITLDEPRPATELQEIVLEPEPEPEPEAGLEPERLAEARPPTTAGVITPPAPAPETSPRRWHRA